MLRRLGDFDRTFTIFDDLRRRMDRVWEDFDYEAGPSAASLAGPRVSVVDAGANLVLKAEVPGMTEKDLLITLDADTLAISGERKVDVPEGYTVHRQERRAVKFARTFTLPCKVDAERTTAAVKDGVLTITAAKAAQAQPRQIAVRAH